jgi:hypothetical protein
MKNDDKKFLKIGVAAAFSLRFAVLGRLSLLRLA